MGVRTGRLALCVAVLAIGWGAVHPAAAQPKPAPAAPDPTQPSVARYEFARIKPFLDKAGGYLNRFGGYYSPDGQTYRDKDGGYLDNWGGYTYADGSYKSKFGDYYDGPKRLFETTDGRKGPAPAGMTNAEAIRALRENVEQNGGYDKNYIRNGMINNVGDDHLSGR
jgi:hypothetical protein